MSKSECQVWEQDLIECVSGDSPQLADRQMLQHAAECQSCGELLWIHLRLTASEPAVPMPAPARFAQMRSEVLERVAETTAPARISRPPAGAAGSFKSLVSNLFLNPLFAYALLILMVFSTAIFRTGQGPDPDSWLSSLESEIGRQAKLSTGLQESSDSSYILSNLSIRELSEEAISLDFDVTTHLQTVRRPDDPLVREALAQSLTSGSSVGTKLRAIEFTEDLPDRKITEGLIFAALHDQSPVVRMSALDMLTRSQNDPQVQRACLEILAGDDSVQMRLIAIDYLGRNPEILRRALDQKWSQDPALRLRAATYLQ